MTTLATNSALGQTSPGIDVEYLTRQGVDERLQSDGVDLLGDKVDMNTGSLVFRHTDVAIPGNSGLEVAVHRRRTTGRRYLLTDEFEFADWEIEAPKMTMLVGQIRQGSYLEPANWPGNRCTEITIPIPKLILPWPYNPFIPQGDGYILESYEYSNGLNLEIPGEGSKPVLDIGSSSQWPSGTKKVTTDNWAISCIADIGAANGGGQGFVATAPNGDRYTFDKLVFRKATQIDYANEALERSTAMMLATEVTDVNGNWVRYVYNSAGILTRIHSNDGRAIDLTYVNGVINQVVANAGANQRVWNYAYVSGQSISTKLTTVTLPDNRSWSFDLGKMDDPADPTYDCTQAGYTVSVTHPNGVTGYFTFAETRHLKGETNGRTSKSRSCLGKPPSMQPYFDTMSVSQKSLSGPGYPAATWTYSYYGYTGGAVSAIKWGQVIDPLGRKAVHTFYRAGDFQGKPQKVELFATSGALVEGVHYSYLAEAEVGTNYMLNENFAVQRQPRRNTTTVVTRGTDAFTTARTYNTTQSSSLYSHGYPTRVTRSTSTTSDTRIADYVYAHNRTKWVLGLPSTVTKNGKLFDSYTFDSLGRFTQHNAFGNLRQKVGYHTAAGQQGAVAWVEDALTRRTQFANYYRGRPRLITRADNTTLSRTVDDNGWVESDTDPMGVTTNYQYNNVGWLTLIDRPNQLTDTTIAYSGLGGSFTQTSTRGTARVTTSYDSFTRPYLVKTAPLSGGGKTSYVKTTYDALGQVTFASFPSSSSSPADGTTTTYDEFGRPKVVAENVAPYATTTYAYVNTNRTKITDPEGNLTTYYYHGFGSPGQNELRIIAQPMGVSTYLYRNDYGQVYRLRQLGTHNGYSLDRSQYSYYDSQLRLCRQSTPEGGHTLYAYNNANELSSYAKGASAGSNCSTPSGNTLVSVSYDNLGRIALTDFQDANTPDIALAYDVNGNVLSIDRVAGNSADNVNWTYTYDNANNLKSEQLQLDGRSYNLAYNYDNDGRLTQRTLPSSEVVNYAFNGLGQATSVSNGTMNYASNMAYHVNGSLESANYGNGHVLSKTWTPRQQPLRVFTQMGGTRAIDQTYLYNANGKITSVTDAADTGNNRSYDYDDLGRLTIATGPWGSGTFKYDPLANLREKTLGTRTVTVSYDAVLNRAIQSTDTAAATRSIDYDARGNVKTLGAMTFVYDITDQPVSQTGSVPATYVYDGNLKRAKQTLGGEIIYSVYDASGAMVHRDSMPENNITANEVTEYISAGGTEVRLENGTTKYTFKDSLGSPVTGTTSAGSISWRERYTPYGEKLLDPAANRDEPGYTGHIQDDATGLTYMQARYYDPVIGRFLSIDPVGFSPDRPFMFNRYAYVGNDPINLVDRSGKSAVAVILEVAAADAVTPDPTDAAAVYKVAAYAGAVVVAVGIDYAIGVFNESDDGDSEPSGEDGESEEAVSKNAPGSRVNPDGSPKNPVDQLDEIESADKGGRAFAETKGKSEQGARDAMRDLTKVPIDELDEVLDEEGF